MVLRVATEADNYELAQLSRLTPMEGTISVCIMRQPDFFKMLYRMGQPHVIVAEENKKIIGCVSIVKEEVILLNKPETLYYLCDLKVHPQHRNKKVATELSFAMHQYLLKQNADWLFSTVANKNFKVMPLFNGKAGIKNVEIAGKYIILQLIPKKGNIINTQYSVVEYKEEAKIIDLHRQFALRYSLHSVIEPELYKDCFHFAALRNGEPIAIISLIDPKELKQNVLIKIPWYYKIALSFLRITKPLLNTPYMPHSGESIRILYIKEFSFLPENEDAFISLVEFASQYAWKNNYSFLSVTFNEKDTLRERFRKFKSFPFIAYGLICSLKNNSEQLAELKAGNVFKDFSQV